MSHRIIEYIHININIYMKSHNTSHIYIAEVSIFNLEVEWKACFKGMNGFVHVSVPWFLCYDEKL